MQAEGAVQLILVAFEEGILVRDLDDGEAEFGIDLRANGVNVAPPLDIPVPCLAVVIAHVECDGLDLVPPAVAEAPEAVEAYALRIAAAQGLVEINLVAVARFTLELDGRLGREDERSERDLERIGEQVRRCRPPARCDEPTGPRWLLLRPQRILRKSLLEVCICMSLLFPARSMLVGPYRHHPPLRSRRLTPYLPIRLLWRSNYIAQAMHATCLTFPSASSYNVRY